MGHCCYASIVACSLCSGVTTSTVEGHIRQCNPHCSFVYSPLALVGAMGLGTGDEGDDDVPLTECVLHTMQSVRRQALPEPYLHTHDVAPMNSLYLTMPSLPVSQHNVRELTAKISDPKQSKVRILLGKMHVEGYARQVGTPLAFALLSRSFGRTSISLGLGGIPSGALLLVPRPSPTRRTWRIAC